MISRRDVYASRELWSTRESQYAMFIRNTCAVPLHGAVPWYPSHMYNYSISTGAGWRRAKHQLITLVKHYFQR